MELGLQNKVVLITGGSKGIGLACASAFLLEGAKVAIAARNLDGLQSARKELLQNSPADWEDRLLTVQADLRQPEAAESMVDVVHLAWGPIDVLVNSAGAARRTSWQGLSASSWREAMEAKYYPYMYAMQAVSGQMLNRQSGVMVNLIGMGGKIADPIHLPGGAANAALMLTTTGLAAAWAGQGIRVVGINPSFTRTGRVTDRIEIEAKAKGLDHAEMLRQKEAQIPIGRMATPAEVAQVVLFVSSQPASYVTGSIINLAGGANPIV